MLRSQRACRFGLVALGVFGFFFNVNLRVQADGSGRLLVEFPPNPLTSIETESHRFGSAVSSVTGFRIRDGRAQVRVRFTDVNGLKDVPGLSNSILTVHPDSDGTWRFQALLRTTAPGDQPVLRNTETARIQVRLPGPILGGDPQRIEGTTAIWREPVRDFLSWDGIQIEAIYQSPHVSAEAPSTGGTGPG